jgi:hypothetical protein
MWWDYSKYLVWQRPLWIEAFERSGGGALRARQQEIDSRLQDVEERLGIPGRNSTL